VAEGLNTGPAVVGNMGSSTRFNYTMMGDTVNLAARCESGAKTYGVYNMVTEDTESLVSKQSNDIIFRFVDRIVVKGRSKAVGVYEIVGLRDELSQATLGCIETYEKAFKKYLMKEWDEALALFEQSSPIEPLRPGRNLGVSINPSLLFIKRCQYMKQNPPIGEWDGVFVMDHK